MRVAEHHDAILMYMRTTVSLDDDVTAEINRVRREEGLGLSTVVNQLIRQGISSTSKAPRYVHRSAPLDMRLDVTNIGDVLEILDES